MNRKGKYANGVPWYTTGTATIRVHFPTDDVNCFYCNFCRDDSMGRYWCRLTGSMIYSLETVGYHCPIKIDTKTEEE